MRCIQQQQQKSRTLKLGANVYRFSNECVSILLSFVISACKRNHTHIPASFSCSCCIRCPIVIRYPITEVWTSKVDHHQLKYYVLSRANLSCNTHISFGILNINHLSSSFCITKLIEINCHCLTLISWIHLISTPKGKQTNKEIQTQKGKNHHGTEYASKIGIFKKSWQSHDGKFHRRIKGQAEVPIL